MALSAVTWAQNHVPLRYRPPAEEKTFLESKGKDNQFPKPERMGTMGFGTAWPHIWGPGCTAALADLIETSQGVGLSFHLLAGRTSSRKSHKLIAPRDGPASKGEYLTFQISQPLDKIK